MRKIKLLVAGANVVILAVMLTAGSVANAEPLSTPTPYTPPC